MSKDNGGPAFPCEQVKNFVKHMEAGMTLRDYFAAKAMASIIAGNFQFDGPAGLAKQAYEMADAMLVERNK
ncbi:hypothetical protein ACVA51_13655 [Pseudomonas luteola]